MAFAELKRARLRLGSNRLSGRGFEWGHRPRSRPIEVWGFDGNLVPAEGWLSLTLKRARLRLGSNRLSGRGFEWGVDRERGRIDVSGFNEKLVPAEGFEPPTP